MRINKENPLYKKLYNVFQQTKSRCHNENHKRFSDYWGRWIICEWKNFNNFYKDMWVSYSEWLQIDRIDNNWNYCLKNCQWITASQNSKNRRNTIYIEWICLKDYCKNKSLNYNTIFRRIKVQWLSPEFAVSY